MIKKINIFLCGALLLLPVAGFAQRQNLMANYSITKQAHVLDSIIAKQIDEDLEEGEFDLSNPADDLYEGAWSTVGVNANRVPYENVPDSIKFDCKGFNCPIEGKYITSPFGPRWSRYHYGTDLKLNVGDTVVSAFDGKVRVTSYDRGGYGYYVVVRHDNGLETVYGHLSKILVSDEQTVKAGQCIALGGNTGRSTGPHLHFEARFLGNPINPELLFDFSTGIPIYDEYLMTKDVAFSYKAEADALKKKASAIKYHKVKSGETLSSIAKKRGTTVANLKKLNKKALGKGTTIRPGQKIRYS